MKLLAILIAIGAEQWRVVGWRRGFENLYVRYLRHLEIMLAGSGTWVATMIALLPFLLILLVDRLVAPFWWLWLAWSALALYLTMGFRHFSHHLTDIRDALNESDLPKARQALHEWQGTESGTLSSDEIALHAIENGAVAMYRSVFGVLFWFFVFGAPGAAVYWMLAAISREWANVPVGEDISVVGSARAEFGRAARWLLFIVDWVPVRLLAFTFAIVGSFEDAIYQWRALPDDFGLFDNAGNENVLLATGMGALGLSWTPRAPSSIPENESFAKDDETNALQTMEGEGGIASDDNVPTSGEEIVGKEFEELGAPPPTVKVTPTALPSAIALAWRSLLFWLLSIFAVTFITFIS